MPNERHPSCGDLDRPYVIYFRAKQTYSLKICSPLFTYFPSLIPRFLLSLSLLPLQIASSSSSFPLTMLVACNAAPENRSPKQSSEVQVFLYISQLSGKVGNITLLRFYTTTDIYRQSTHGGKKNGKKIPDTGVFSRETVSSSLLMQT